MTATGQDNPLVSVVMPVHNVAPWVRAAVQSILQQSCTNLELLVVYDDGLTDDTLERLSSIEDPRLRLVFSPQCGFLASLNEGIRQSRGEWIARMDGDDICHPDRLQCQIDFLSTHPDCVLVGTAYGYVTPNGALIKRRRGEFDWRALTPNLISLGKRFADASALFHRSTALDVGLYELSMATKEAPLWYRLLTRGTGYEIGHCLYWQRMRIDSISSDRSDSTAWWETRRQYDPEWYARHEANRRRCASPEELLEVDVTRLKMCMAGRDFAGARFHASSIWERKPWTYKTFRYWLWALTGIYSFRFWRSSHYADDFVPYVPENDRVARLLTQLGARVGNP